ncbi:MAG TPA: hypothetical protein VMV18_02655, partial [bacterium]|nr:hypothetical protein [bacterium]
MTRFALLSTAGLLLLSLPVRAETHRDAALRAFAEGDASGVRALRAESGDVALRNLACAATLAEGARASAVKCWNAVMTDAPSDPAASDNLGALALQEGDAAAAASHFGHALGLDFSDVAALSGLAQAE